MSEGLCSWPPRLRESSLWGSWPDSRLLQSLHSRACAVNPEARHSVAQPHSMFITGREFSVVPSRGARGRPSGTEVVPGCLNLCMSSPGVWLAQSPPSCGDAAQMSVMDESHAYRWHCYFYSLSCHLPQQRASLMALLAQQSASRYPSPSGTRRKFQMVLL